MDKLNRAEAISIINRYIGSELLKLEWYLAIRKYLKAIVFYGSTSKGLNRLDSDIDLLIFVPLEIEKKYTSGEYFYSFEGREINIVLRSIERLRKLANGPHDNFESEVFRSSEIILESDSEVRDLIQIIRG